MRLLRFLALASALIPAVLTADAEAWRKRSIYQVLTDRYALPVGVDPTRCDPAKQEFCGGTWQAIKNNLDYIQNAGFTAIWISPVSQNYQGPRTAYGEPYHGYWIADVTKLNDRFGTANDLRELSNELHRRGMFLMVDVVVNNVMATSTHPDLSPYLFKEKSQYHDYCPIEYGNVVSQQNCWLGDEKVTLPDVNTEDLSVVEAYTSWIKALVNEFKIDGLRIDAAKHVNVDFWPQFCGAAGVYCIGEVFDKEPSKALEYQGDHALDAILNYPTYHALVAAFAIPGPQNMSALVDVIAQTKAISPDPTLLGNFLEDHDVPRWANISVDPQSLWNAMIFNFMSDGIPIVYYGQEQGFSGNADPHNREPMWPSKYVETTSYQLIKKLNTLRNFLVFGNSGWETDPMKVLAYTEEGIVFAKGDVTTFLTNIGSPPQNVTLFASTRYKSGVSTTDVLTCRQHVVASNGTIVVEYSRGGVPVILVPETKLAGSGLCGYSLDDTATLHGVQGSVRHAGVERMRPAATAVVFGLFFAVVISMRVARSLL